MEYNNRYTAVKRIKHGDLEKPYGDIDSLYRRVCPICKNGLLLLGRDQDSLKLLPHDICVLCGQRFIYDDIEELRKEDFAGPFS